MGTPIIPANSPGSYSAQYSTPPLWQSINMQQFIADEIQRAMDLITQAVDSATVLIDAAIAIARMYANLSSAMFDLVAALIKSIAEQIKALLNFIPEIGGGIYFLWIPMVKEGTKYYLDSFKDSLDDSLDKHRPQFPVGVNARAIFVLGGAPIYDPLAVKKMGQSFKKLGRFFGVKEKVGSLGDVAPPQDFQVEKKYFNKVKTLPEWKSNSIKLPSNPNDPSGVSYVRTKLRAISRDSGKMSIYAMVSWDLPEGFNKFTGKKHVYIKDETYTTKKDGSTKHAWEFVRKTQAIRGLLIMRAETIADLRMCTTDMLDMTLENIEDEDYIPMSGTSEVKTYSYTNSPGNNFHMDEVPEIHRAGYVYAAAFIYAEYSAHVEVEIHGIGSYTITENENADEDTKKIRKDAKAGVPGTTAVGVPINLNVDMPNFELADPADIDYTDYPEDKWVYNTTDASNIAVLNTEPNVSNNVGAAPDWLSYKGILDLLPEVSEIISKMNAAIDAVVDGLVDDVNAMKEWVEENIAALEDMLQEINEVLALIKSLMFPPMLGLHYMYTESTQGVHGIVKQLELSMQGQLVSSGGSYNTALLDTDYKNGSKEEFIKNAAIPAYDKNHSCGGFVLMFQDPAFKIFWENMIGLPNAISDLTKDFMNDARLQMKSLKLPELKFPQVPGYTKYQHVPRTSVDEAMHAASDAKAGIQDPDAVDTEGNVSAGSKTGPYENKQAESFSVTADGKTNSVVVPAGNVTAAMMVSLLGDDLAYENEGSFYLRAKESLFLCPCNNKLATLFGFADGLSLIGTPPKSLLTHGEPFAYVDGDLLTELIGYGQPDMEMRKSTPAIFEFNEFDGLALGPDSYQLDLEVDGDRKTVDVTGNLGMNQKAANATHEFEITFPIKIEADTNDKFYMRVPDGPEDIPETDQLVTMAPGTYNNAHEIMVAMLVALDKAGYRFGMFETNGLSLVAGFDGEFVISGAMNHGFLVSTDMGNYVPQLEDAPYLLADIARNIDAAFPGKRHVAVIDGRLRIYGKKIGSKGRVYINCAGSDMNSRRTALALFGLPVGTVYDVDLAGLGKEMTRNELWVKISTQLLCTRIVDEKRLETAVVTPELLVEVREISDKEYLIEIQR